MQKRKSSQNLIWLCKTALFAALLMMLQLTGLGMIKTPWGLAFTVYGVVVTVGTLAIDLKAGIILSVIFGGISAWQNGILPIDPLNPLFTMRSWSVWAVFINCLIPRLLIPLTSYGSRLLLKHTKLNEHVSLAINGLVGSLTNTLFFLGMMMLLYAIMGTMPDAIVAYAGTVVTTNGIAEAIIAALATPAIVLTLSKLK